MQPSMFNVRVPLETAGQRDVFLMNTFTDAQLIVSPDVAALLDRVGTTAADALSAERTRRPVHRSRSTASSSDDREARAAAHRAVVPRPAGEHRRSCGSPC